MLGEVLEMRNSRYFNVSRSDNVVTAEIVDSYLSGGTISELIRLELATILELSPEILIIDFRNVKLIGTGTIDGFLQIIRRTAVGKTQLMFCCMSESLRAVFKTLNLDGTVFKIYETAQEALAAKRGTYHEVVGERYSPDEDLE